MTALLDKNKTGNDYYRHQCGGALIHPRLVLTAAHCVVDNGRTWSPSRLEVALGKRRLSADGGEHINVSRIVVHPSYDRPRLAYDLALLYLERPSAYTPAPLADPTMQVFQGNVVTTMGWGKTQGQGDYYKVHSDDLKAVDTAIWSDANCQAAGVNATDAGFYRNYYQGASMICAGYSDIADNTCNGDSGSPMMIPDAARQWRLLDIVSWGGIGCLGYTSPTVYAWTQGADMHSFITRGIAEAGQNQSVIPSGQPQSSTGLTVSNAGLSKVRVRAGRALTVRFNSTGAGQAQLKVSRSGRRIGTWTADVAAGDSALKLITRDRGRKFRPGSYRIAVQVTAAGRRSNTALLGFRVTR